MRSQIIKAHQLVEKGRKDEAELIFNDISFIETDDLRDRVERGRLALALDENVFALNSFGKAVEEQPENVGFIYLLASAYVKIGNMTFAAKLCRKALSIDPEHYESHVILGMQATASACFPEAVEIYEKAIQLKPSDPSPYRDMIYSLSSVDRHEEAHEYAKKLIRLEPNAYNYIVLSRILAELGENKEAISTVEKAIRIDGACGYAYLELTTIKKITEEDRQLLAKAEKALTKSIPAAERSTIHFSLGKAYNDLKEWDKAFEHYKQGNLLGKEATEPLWLTNYYRVAKKTYTKSLIQKTDVFGSSSDIPVFIVGMPRSGTTLLEQIIASHPQAGGAGELTAISGIHHTIFSSENKTAKDIEKHLTGEALGDYADDYLKISCAGRESASRVVDKQPHNFAVMGLIYKLFPNARFLHTVRNPLDTCLSCYFQPFARVPQSYDLDWLGKTYRMYREAIDYWKKILPEGSILDVEYEQVVNDIEAQGRRVIDFCDLPWDPQCLEFYKTRRAITTASVWQARQPIYSSSKKRWMNYAEHLGPLVNQIGDYLDDDDITELEKHGVKIRKKWGLKFLKRTQ